MANWLSDFFNGPEVQNFNDPYSGQLDQIMQRLQSGQLGKDVASQSTGYIRRQAEDNLRGISNSGVGRNAAVLSRLTDKTLSGADQGIIGAQVEGEKINQSALGQAASIGENQRNFQYEDFLRRDAQRRQPSPFASLLNTAVGTVAGGLTGGLGLGLAQNIFNGLTKKNGGDDGPDSNRSGSGSNYQGGWTDFQNY